jgi:hypothetical protein
LAFGNSFRRLTLGGLHLVYALDALIFAQFYGADLSRLKILNLFASASILFNTVWHNA